MRFAVAVLLAAAAAWAADAPSITFSKSFPGSLPAFFAITVERTGDATYNESEDPDNLEKFQLESGATAEMFELAERMDRFKKPLESGLKVANMGQKTLRFEAGGERSETKFNYSSNEDAKLLTDRFERIGESLRTLLELRRAARHDRLGVNAAVLKIQSLWENRRLLATAQFLPLLDQVANDEAYIHMARERAAQIADAIRATSK
ncbi:MAG: hypothetical protein M3N41_07790 [Acidobacteriota bacterium]|nr:hypothetical protein [Acidobacteriota bacterium]MDP9112967.1 hypothetical protein [Acidobacteriota bacterium]